MQPIRKKQRKTLPHGRMLLLAALAMLLAGSVGAYLYINRTEETPAVEASTHSGVIKAAEEADVASLRITLRNGESWILTQDETGAIAVDGDNAYKVAQRKQQSLLRAAAAVTYQDVLTEDASAYAENFGDFGLETPRVVAEITYRDGSSLTLRIGDSYALEESGWCYMTVDGDSRLFALDTGTADDLAAAKSSLHPVEQPILHKARFDRISFTGEGGSLQALWELQGGIGGDAEDRWLLTEPVRYPAEGDSMSGLLANLENLRLGAYVGEATEENLRLYGFEEPRFVIRIHMAAGSMGTTGAQGVYDVTDWPESSFTLTVGGAKNESVDYVLLEGSIYLTSHFSLKTFMEMEPSSTLTRYTVPTALGNLERMTIETSEGTEVYEIQRTEQVASNNDLVYDAAGNLLYDHTCTRNGVPVSYEAFEAAYNSLLVVTASGRLPDGWTTDAWPHTVYTFTQTDGTVHTVALAEYDPFHDAIIMDGNAAFYIIKDGMRFGMQ